MRTIDVRMWDIEKLATFLKEREGKVVRVYTSCYGHDTGSETGVVGWVGAAYGYVGLLPYKDESIACEGGGSIVSMGCEVPLRNIYRLGLWNEE